VIVVDTSALLAILLDEPSRAACLGALREEPDLVISAGTMTEAFVAAEYKGLGPEMLELIEELSPEAIPVTGESARLALHAFRQWGKGRHPAGLNFGDCFSYVAAKQMNCPLLFVGNDFGRTDVIGVL
jgi:ribonuclease VapC